MREYLTLGPAPCDEDCAQVGQPDYHERARHECRRFILLIRQKLGPEPEGAWLSTKSFPHDFGTYYEVVCYFNTEIQASVDYASRCEAETPATWEA
jgi:hypothetical protein